MATTNANKMMAIHKMLNLQHALAECDIESTLSKMEDGTLTLTSTLWNCFDGSDVEFTVYAEANDNYENIAHYADTHDHDEEILALLDEINEKK